MSNVLLIENNSVLAQVYVRSLEHAGFKVRLEADAQQAIHAADIQKPDVVVMEMQLPGRNGIEFLQEFRSYTDWRKIPVVVHTMLPLDVINRIQYALERDFGIKDILYKPRTGLQDLVNIVRAKMP